MPRLERMIPLFSGLELTLLPVVFRIVAGGGAIDQLRDADLFCCHVSTLKVSTVTISGRQEIKDFSFQRGLQIGLELEMAGSRVRHIVTDVVTLSTRKVYINFILAADLFKSSAGLSSIPLQTGPGWRRNYRGERCQGYVSERYFRILRLNSSIYVDGRNVGEFRERMAAAMSAGSEMVTLKVGGRSRLRSSG